MSTVESLAQTVIGPEHNGTLMSPDEFDAIEEWNDEFHYELINCVLVVNSPSPIHVRAPNELLGYLLWQYHGNDSQECALDYTIWENLISSGPNRRRADRVVWTGLGRVPNVNHDVPTIVIEFVSIGSRDRRRDYETKRKEYGMAGVTEYWIIDRFERKMTAVSYAGKTPQEKVIAEDGIYKTSLLPGFELQLAKLLGESDKFQ